MLKILSYLTPIVLLLIGLVFMALASLVQKVGVPQWLTLLLIFAIFNFAIAYYFGMTDRMWSAWAPRKIYQLAPGLILGLLPIGISILASFWKGDAVSFSWEKITFSGMMITLAIVSWEELWFRGMALELGALKFSILGAAVIFGGIFLALHALNPEIHLLREGLELFLAGYTLCACYFYFGSIWAPIGMHFANNFTEALLKENKAPPIEEHKIIYVVVLALVALVLTVAIFRSTLKSGS